MPRFVAAEAGTVSLVGSWNVTLAGQRSRPCWPVLLPLLCQSTQQTVTLVGGWRAKLLTKLGGELQSGSLSPTLVGCLGTGAVRPWETSGVSKNFLHSSSTILLYPRNHFYSILTENCEQLKMPLVNWHLLSPKMYPKPGAHHASVLPISPSFSALELYLWSMHPSCPQLFPPDGGRCPRLGIIQGQGGWGS